MNPYQNYSDIELVARLNRGDANAFEAIYKRYAADLFKYARKNISTKEDCEEILQEIFASLWERHKVIQIESLRHYLLTSVRYKIIRYIQHNVVRKKFAEHYRLFEVIYESIEPDERTDDRLYTMMINVVGDLPPRCQAAIKLRLFENLSNGQIAERLNITKKTVEVYMLRAFNHFRSLYNKRFECD